MNEKCVRVQALHVCWLMVKPDSNTKYKITEQTVLNIEHEWKTESLLLFVWMHFAILITYNRIGISDPINHWQMINFTMLSNQALWIANSHACIQIFHNAMASIRSTIWYPNSIIIISKHAKAKRWTSSIQHRAQSTHMCSSHHSRFRANE